MTISLRPLDSAGVSFAICFVGGAAVGVRQRLLSELDAIPPRRSRSRRKSVTRPCRRSAASSRGVTSAR
jgi:hypothetical protein